MDRHLPSSEDERGASNTLGLVILFGMVLVGATLIFLIGGMATEQIEQENEVQSAEMSMQEVRSDIASLSSRGEGSTELRMNADDEVSIVADGEMTFTIHGWTETGTYRDDCTTNLALNSFEYENDNGERVAYQGGGVWKQTNGGSTMVSPPSISYRSERIDGDTYRTFDFSVANLTGRIDNSGETTAAVNKTWTRERQETITNEMFCRDDGNGNVTRVRSLQITVENSTYYDAWGRYFETKMGDSGNVTVYDGNQTVVVRDLPLGKGGPIGVPGHDDLLVAVNNTAGADTSHKLTFGVKESDGITGDTLEGIKIKYEDGETDLADLKGKGPGVRGHINQNRSKIYRADGGTVDLKNHIDSYSVDTSDNTIEFQFDDSVQINANDTIALEFGSQNRNGKDGKVTNPGSAGNYNATVKLNDDDDSKRTGYLRIGDDDGVPEYADECPNVDGEGRNGCGVISEDEDENALRLNSSSGTIELLGTEIAEERTINKTVAERKPLDVMFVLDRSGSMGQHNCQWVRDERNRDKVDWAAVDGNYYTVPDEVAVWDQYERQWKTSGQQLYIEGNRRLTVADYECDPGMDPDGKRVEATRSFVGALNASAGDKAGAVEFNSDLHHRHDLTADFDALNGSITDTANGGTNISTGLYGALDELEEGGNDEQVVVLLSDGENNVNGYSQSQLDEMTRDAAERAAANNVTVYTIGLGEGADEDLLGDVANETGGEYHYVDGAEDLEDIFEQIAGDETRDRTRAVEHKTVETEVQIGGKTYSLDPSAADGPVDPDGPGGAINDPTRSGSVKFRVDNLSIGSLLSFSARSVDCTNGTDTGLESDHNGDTYAHTTCNGTSGTIDDVDNSSKSDHQIYTDGEDLPTLSTAWWQPDIESILDDDHHSGGEFDLGDDQAIIVMELDNPNASHTDYTVFLYDADAGDRSNGGSNSNANPDDDNQYVIDISPIQVDVGDDG
ncbi:vWA domain-containing protein [Halostella pelagica]|uniref:vWA domain-containing protein n=1 Tax=Halostella pelagica TaxID=2583824 RepID=UPI001081A9DD|nr:vWA domain-containing protein [Halostella pelagica]